MYYGEELGMRTTDPARIEDVHDPMGKIGLPKEKGRDGERTPMQWDGSKEAGFTIAAKPWLPIPSNAVAYNVEAEAKDPDSIYIAYKLLLTLRKFEAALGDGSYEALNEDDPNVFAYLRRSGDSTILVALNMSGQPRTVAFQLEGKGVAGSTATPLYSSPSSAQSSIQLQHVELAPFGALVAAVR
jgi:alpha-glucosidase